jgi:hypothetical protein
MLGHQADNRLIGIEGQLIEAEIGGAAQEDRADRDGDDAGRFRSAQSSYGVAEPRKPGGAGRRGIRHKTRLTVSSSTAGARSATNEWTNE